METDYGWKQVGKMPVIFVVPHGGDPVEGMIARAAERLRPLDVSLVVNTRMRRRVVNFNDYVQLRRSNDEKAMAFWRDVKAAVEKVLLMPRCGAFVYFIHNAEATLKRGSKIFPRRKTPDGDLVYSELTQRDPRPYDVDIGCGQTGLLSVNGSAIEALTMPELEAAFCRHLVPAETIYPRRGSGAVVTFSPDKLLALVCLIKSLQPAWLVEVGREFAAQKLNNLSQSVFRRFRDTGRVATVQFEFLDTLPEKAVAEMLVGLSLFR